MMACDERLKTFSKEERSEFRDTPVSWQYSRAADVDSEICRRDQNNIPPKDKTLTRSGMMLKWASADKSFHIGLLLLLQEVDGSDLSMKLMELISLFD
ncbi:unnamed protein product [Microthlaspi erraticum]|uniref:Uncharacterized protein n=1 Tax=Microthlaspi erraticum TaxID=1685480 RepID=A0A6D2IGG8_9BRAS|nr:unnamed protein product [Microthlaspi erraticum]